jgi:hypothetical protein
MRDNPLQSHQIHYKQTKPKFCEIYLQNTLKETLLESVSLLQVQLCDGAHKSTLSFVKFNDKIMETRQKTTCLQLSHKKFASIYINLYIKEGQFFHLVTR